MEIKLKAERAEYKKKKIQYEDCVIEENPDGDDVVPQKDSKMGTKTGKFKKDTKEQPVVEKTENTNEVLESDVVQQEPEVDADGNPIVQQVEETVEQVIVEEDPVPVEYSCPYASEFYNRNSFDFPHKIYKCADGKLPDSKTALDVIKHLALICKKEFNFDFNNSGASLIMGPKFICFVPYNKEYRNHYNVKLFVQPWYYLNFFTMPDLEKQYPETAEIKECQKSYDFENIQSILRNVYVDKGIEEIIHPVLEEVVEDVE